MTGTATTATIDASRSSVIEIELTRSDSERRMVRLLRAIEHDAERLAAELGFAAASVHVSDDGTIVSCIEWADDDAREAARTTTGLRLGAHHSLRLTHGDGATYEVVYAQARDGDKIRIEPDAPFATLIDVLEVDPARQEEIVSFNVSNGQAFATQPGFRATSVLRGRDGRRNATYSQWERVEDWITAVKTTAGERVPGLSGVETVAEVNEVLQAVGHEMGNVPEYHAYRVSSVIGPVRNSRPA